RHRIRTRERSSVSGTSLLRVDEHPEGRGHRALSRTPGTMRMISGRCADARTRGRVHGRAARRGAAPVRCTCPIRMLRTGAVHTPAMAPAPGSTSRTPDGTPAALPPGVRSPLGTGIDVNVGPSESGNTMEIRFWGVRGSVATSGPEMARIGGNTSCVEVTSQGHRLILDAGTGLRGLGKAMHREGGAPESLMLFSHLHWDHVQGFPFFGPP